MKDMRGKVSYVVSPFPDETSHQARVLVKGVNVLLDATGTIAHGVDILAKHERLGPVLLRRRVDNLFSRGVHPAIDIRRRRIPIALVVHKTGLVDTLYHVVHVLVVSPVEGLVAQRPQDDRGVVLVALDHLPRAILIGLSPIWVISGPAFARVSEDAEAVTLEVSLIEDPNAELVCEVVKAGVIDVVGGTDAVNVEVLHQKQVAFQEVVRHGAARVRVMLVAVHAADLDGVAVYAEDPLDQLSAAETHTLD